METLVIHPKDSTTDFLSDIYSDEKDWTVIRENPSKKLLKQLIKTHDRIIMLGHGSENGLFGFDKLIINSKWIYLLRQKYCVCIWCNAIQFVEKYKLNGFYTGMIISDYMEANLYCINATNDEIEESNMLFAKSIKDNLFDEYSVKEIYQSNVNPVIMFNNKNIYSNEH